MGTDFLLALQNLREGAGAFFGPVMDGISLIFSPYVFAVVFLFVYLCIDKRLGTFGLLCFGLTNLVGEMLKALFCIDRPWVKDSRITPYGNATASAGGYSLPSAHVFTATTTLGAVAWYDRKHKAWIAVAIIVVLLLSTSRMFLGVHTPLDVITGIVLGVAGIIACAVALDWAESHPESDSLFTITGCIIALAALTITALRVTSMQNQLGDAFDPNMFKSAYESAGILAGILVGWYLERRFAGFNTDHINVKQIGLAVVSIAVCFLLWFGMGKVFPNIFGILWGGLIQDFILFFVGVGVCPIAIARFQEAWAAPTEEEIAAQKAQAKQAERAKQQAIDAARAQSKRKKKKKK